MSVYATSWAWNQQGLSPYEKLVLLSMADRADEDFCCWPSIPRLMVDTGIGNHRTVIKAIKRLEELGIIQTCRDDGKSNRYVLVGVSDLTTGKTATGKTATGKTATPTPGKTATTPLAKLPPLPVAKLPLEPTSEPTKNLSGEPTNTPACARVGSPPKKPGGVLCPDDIPPNLWADWLEVRKAKRVGPVTQTALETLRTEADKAGLPLSSALKECCSRGWAGFKASWLERENSQPRAGPFRRSEAAESRLAVARTIFGDMTNDNPGRIIDITPDPLPALGGEDFPGAPG